MAAPIDDYLARLREELRRHGCEDARLIDEAREHLADDIDDGLRRGLTAEDAEREAFERFGPPDVIARSSIKESSGMRNWLRALPGTLWWFIAPTVVAAVATSAISYYFLPTRYRSETVIRVQSPGTGLAGTTARATGGPERLLRIAETALTRARLERLIQEVGLYRAERAQQPLDEVVERMRRDIGVTLLNDANSPAGDGSGSFVVSFAAPDPRLAMKTTERLASLLVEQNMLERTGNSDTTGQFFDEQIGSMRQRLVAQESQLARARASGQPVPEADVLAYEVLRDMYKSLLVRREEARSAESLERSAAGFQFRVTEPARLPIYPEGPSRLGVTTAGTLAGFGLGLLFVAMRGRWAAPIMHR